MTKKGQDEKEMKSKWVAKVSVVLALMEIKILIQATKLYNSCVNDDLMSGS